MNDASHNHGEQENTVSTYSVDVETLQQIALKGDAQALFQLAINYEPVSYTHLTLPTICSV